MNQIRVGPTRILLCLWGIMQRLAIFLQRVCFRRSNLTGSHQQSWWFNV